MKRHSFDPLSFAGGVIFLLIAGSVALSTNLDLRTESWLVPTAILVLGIGLLAATVRTMATPSRVPPSGGTAEERSDDAGGHSEPASSLQDASEE